MSTELVTTGLSPDSESYHIRRQAIEAVEVMFNRVVEQGADRPEPQDANDQVKDNK
jgi:hypothetical protein